MSGGRAILVTGLEPFGPHAANPSGQLARAVDGDGPGALALIREHGCRAGLVFNPATPLTHLDHVIDKVDLVLLMSVNPGFGGQAFIPTALDKLAAARKRIDACGRDIWLEIDGGVKADNIEAIARAGADTFVAGSAIFGANDRPGAISAMRESLKRATMPA